MNENSEGENIQWLVDWMKSQEPQKKFNLRCEKEYDEASSQGWKLRCTTESEAENSKQSQWFSLRLDDPKGDQNQAYNSLCCRPCGHSTTPRCRTVISLKRYLQIYRWVFPKDSTARMEFLET
ncbi:hypothetical protein GH714_002674 [Hevea brasiliensis]|uniref:Uncharacterized protein n=1 Tax=Hevea brasiliensis TaxID=3981 RepID=A0A6A6LUM6_HEVBR|nr:hypothetical protein GH714_002674 [Hevea brasiliensis]